MPGDVRCVVRQTDGGGGGVRPLPTLELPAYGPWLQNEVKGLLEPGRFVEVDFTSTAQWEGSPDQASTIC